MRVSARPEAAPYRTRRGGACLPERNAAPPGVVTLCLPECRVGSPGVPALASGRCRGSAPGESADPSGRPESRIGAPRKSGPLSRGGLLRGGCEFGIIRDMTNHAKSLAVWALAVAGAMAAPLRSEASEHKVSTPPPQLQESRLAASCARPSAAQASTSSCNSLTRICGWARFGFAFSHAGCQAM